MSAMQRALPLHRLEWRTARVGRWRSKTVLADLDGVPVLEPDEVDANVGGEI